MKRRELIKKIEAQGGVLDDKYSPSGLLLGITATGRALHFQVSFAESDLTKIVTIYDPDPEEWIDYRTRK